MKRLFPLSGLLLISILSLTAQNIHINTASTQLSYTVGSDGRLFQTWFGCALDTPTDADRLPWNVCEGYGGSRGREAYTGSGGEDYFEPALGVKYPDGSLTTVLKYRDHKQAATPYGSETTIELSDDLYPIKVTLHYQAFNDQDVIKSWATIHNAGKKSVDLWRYASAMLYLDRSTYYLTEFSSEWAKEVQMTTEQLRPGKKIIDSKLGTRAAMLAQPFFIVGLDGTASENGGEVLMGTLGWTGNFSFTFELDNLNCLRVIPSINPYASTWRLGGGDTFVTPEFVFTLSQNGTSQGSRNLHDWARAYQLKDGNGDRMTLLNNWENTRFDFDQEVICRLIKEAKELGVDLFLLDDGWFGNKYPRHNDHAGLGDWQVTKDRIPGGIKALTDAADREGVKFGIWVEPEMVNPKSALFEKHPDWAYTIAKRDTFYFRNQLALDLNNPAVQQHVFNVIDTTLANNPGVAYFKWDCNSPITNAYSHYLGADQQHLYIGHVRGLYNVLDRVKAKYPNTPMMLCSGGGARCDYKVLEYFTEFWASDNTDPIERLYIQWGFSQFFPVKAICAHVTDWNKAASLKFRTDVASMCKLGFDMSLKGLSEGDMEFVHGAISNWGRLKDVILDGDQYRLVSPYAGEHTATQYVSPDKAHAVLFAFDMNPRYREVVDKVVLQGLDKKKKYLVKEINLLPITDADGNLVRSADGTVKYTPSKCRDNGIILSGDYLMKVGLDAFTASMMHSRVLELVTVED